MIFVLSPLILLDLQNIFNNKREPVKRGKPNYDFTILVPLFGHPKYFQNKKHLEKYKNNVVLCINTSNKLMVDFAKKCKKDGFRVFQHKGAVKSPWQVLRLALNEQLVLLKTAMPAVRTTYTIFLGDSYFVEDPAEAIGAMKRDKIDVASVKVLPKKRETLIQKLQGVEYDIAMFNRLYQPWLTSGACMIGKTKIMSEVMANHSVFFDGGDIEIGRTAFLSKHNIQHVDLTVLTDVPRTFKQFFRQRIFWWSGAFRTIIVNFDSALKSPFWFTYYFIVVWLILPIKWIGLIEFTEVIPAVYLAYVAMVVIANWRVRSPYMIIFPFYSLFQAVVMPPFGVYRYFKYAFQTKNFGRYAKI